MSKPAYRWVLTVALSLVAIVSAIHFARMGRDAPWRRPLFDFTAFYCAGSAIEARQNPYLYEPLHACEHRVNATGAFRKYPWMVVPAPQPLYDLAFLALFARLPFSTAQEFYTGIVVAVVLLCALALRRLLIPLDLALLGFSLPVLFVDVVAGQIEPFAFAALVCTGIALAHGRDALAGCFAALCLIDPRVGVPVAFAVLCFAPKARPVTLATAGALTLVALRTGGIARIALYLARVLPAHAAAETGAANQYSLSYALHALGLAAAPALRLGLLSYALLALLALWLAPRLAATTQRRELLAFLPAACSVTGGPFVHALELPAALPAALVLATALRPPLGTAAGISLLLLAVPWIALWPLPPVAHAVTAAAFAPQALASQAWGAFASGPSSGAWLAVKIPAWCALATLLSVAWLAARAPAARTRFGPASATTRGSWRETRRRAPASQRARTGSNADLA